jgi:hypothetical protein
MKRHPIAVTETTPEGLAALVYHLAHGASQGQLDPEFVRKLAKRVGKELEAMEAADMLSPHDKTQLHQAINTLCHTAEAEEGAMLTKALERLRAEDATNARPI